MPKEDPKIALLIGSKKDDGYGPMQGDKMKDDYEGIRFKAPKGMDMEGHKEGDMVEMVGTFEVEPDGMLCLKKVDGMDVNEEEGETKPDDEEAEGKGGSFTDAVMGNTNTPEEEQESM